MVEHRSDAELLAAHVAGDPDAFGVLFERHRDRLWAVALRTTNDPDEAADGLQDALINAFRNADSYRGEAAVTTWLHRVVVNACLDRLRRRRARPTSPLPEENPESGANPLADPADPLGALEVSMAVSAAMANLGDDQRLAIMLVDVQGFRVDEAAAILGVPNGTIKSRCARGRAKLAVELASLRPTGDLQRPPGNPSSPTAVPMPRPEQGGDDRT